MHIIPGSDDNQVLIGVISYSEDEKSEGIFWVSNVTISLTYNNITYNNTILSSDLRK